MNHSNAFNSIVVELGSETENINPFLEPKEAGYRGIYRNHNASSNERMSFENMGIPPHLPGFHIEVDLKNRKVTVYDPLTRPKHAELRKAFEHYLSNPPRGIARRSVSAAGRRGDLRLRKRLVVPLVAGAVDPDRRRPRPTPRRQDSRRGD